eukprot:SAG31_NODE_126_length_23665_cov_6.178987_21_plen_122_part_00
MRQSMLLVDMQISTLKATPSRCTQTTKRMILWITVARLMLMLAMRMELAKLARLRVPHGVHSILIFDKYNARRGERVRCGGTGSDPTSLSWRSYRHAGAAVGPATRELRERVRRLRRDTRP